MVKEIKELDNNGEIPYSEVRRVLANADQFEQVMETIKNDLVSEISHIREFLQHLNSLEQGAMQAEEIIEESKESVQ